ncbi:alpha/beta hydrolase [Pseudomarimonas salicorniae]|uniref:Alpha/beta hydrolase n=1 Tax=Pseudomarimonas salicorniae TaxID=2933270 RepID=A0ABT0GL46_9GAMM|nr:alpha/beta hydrolase [Lysobacter sp. CAU 1642]MCK7595248.1 alpha/beta hydrolase [Lysobacter sp. CAU 1642]
MLETIETCTRPETRYSIIWLHGLGADGHDFAPIVPELVRPHWPGIRFVFPHAPVMPVTLNGGMHMRAWYDILGMDFTQRREDEPGVRASIGAVETLIAREVERGTPPERILLAGFSQGGAITLATGLRRQEPLLGMIALSTYLPLAESTAAESTDAGRATPVFMAHGSLDPVVPHQAGTLSAQRLRQLGVQVEWHEYPMQHAVCAEEIRDLALWMDARLGS